MTSPRTYRQILRLLWRYMFALGLVGAGVLLCLSIPQVLAPRPFLAFWPMVVAAAQVGGIGPGLLATVASALCVHLILNPPYGGLNLNDWVGMTAVGIFFAGGLAISVFIGGKRKIQSLQRLQAAALATSEQRFRQLFKIAPMPLALSDREGALTLVNDRWEQTFGYTRKEIPTIKDWWRLAYPDPDYRRRVIDTWEASVRHARETCNDTVESHDYRVNCKNGDVRTLEITGTFIEDDLLVAFYDITGRKQAEKSLIESERRYRSLFENMNAGFELFEVVQNEQGIPVDLIIIAANEGFEKTTGLKLRDSIGKHLTQVLPGIEKDEADWIGTFSKVALTGEATQFEQGSELLGYYYSISAFQAGPNQCAVTFIDITGRKAAEAEQRRLFEQVERDRRALISTLEDQRRTEESLRESEERFRRAVIGAPIPIMIHAEDGQVISINAIWTRLTGYEHSDISTIADWTQKAYGRHMDLVRNDIDGLHTLEGLKADGEYTITTSSDEIRIWDFSSAPIGKLPDGRRLVISMATDVTERKQLELERQKFFLLAESSSEFIGMCDLDMNPLYVNPAGRSMVGLPDMAAACRVKVQDYYFPEDQRFIAEEFFPRVLREGHGDVEIRLRHFQTGEPIWMFYYLFSVHDANGTPIGWATVSRDITERRKAENEIRRLNAELEQRVVERTAQLEAANKELEAFSYSVSHDLRAPLRHISGYVDLLNNRFREALPDKARHYLDSVTGSAKQMGTLIDDLLQFSRAGRQELRQADMDMNAAVQEAIEKFKSDMVNRKISWTVADLPLVFGDYSLLKQVWINLLDNAVKYTRYKDEAEIEVGFTEAPDHYVFFVRDNGVGFDMQYANKLFGVFQRLHSPADFEGTGIGLANVQRIVHKHAGRVWAEARPDQGAAFYFTIPMIPIAKEGKS